MILTNSNKYIYIYIYILFIENVFPSPTRKDMNQSSKDFESVVFA